MHTKKILIIDDDPDIRTVIGNLLQRQGYNVVTAGCRTEALEKLEVEKPSVVLLDVLLSGSDGRELCREIKTRESTGHIPVIVVSGHPGAAQKLDAFGADDFLAKPFTSESLLTKLAQHEAPVK